MTIKRIVVTAGEPAGIGPDLVLALSKQSWPHQIVVSADKGLLEQRAKQLDIDVQLIDYDASALPTPQQAGSLVVDHIALNVPATAGSSMRKMATMYLKH